MSSAATTTADETATAPDAEAAATGGSSSAATTTGGGGDDHGSAGLEWRDVALVGKAPSPPPPPSTGAASSDPAVVPSGGDEADDADDPLRLLGPAGDHGASSSSSAGKGKNSCSDAVPLKLYGRDREMLELVEGFRRCCAGGSGSASVNSAGGVGAGAAPPARKELLLVTGHSGSGKTSLVEAALRPAAAERGGWFVSGKFDLLERTEQYYPIVQALSEFARCVALVPAQLHEVQAALEPHKETARVLIDLVPSLADLLLPEEGSLAHDADGAEMSLGSRFSSRCSARSRRQQQLLHAQNWQSNSSSLDPSLQLQAEQPSAPAAGSAPAAAAPGAATRERLKFAVRQFLEAVCGRSSPLVLFLDDLQWAEPASLDLLGYLFQRRIPGLVLVGACRDNELSSFAHLSVLLRELEADGVAITQVPVDNLGVTALSYMICDVLRVDYTKAKVLGAIVLDQTGGNMFFAVQFLRTLVQESLLYRTRDGTWTFESEARIRSVLGPGQSVMHLVCLNIQKQDKAIQDALMVASCLGAEFSEHLLKEAVSCDLEHPLRIAEAKGFLMRRSGTHESTTWRFVHDQIQQSAYALIPVDEREEVHLQIGRKLWRALTEDELDEHANVVVKQLRLGARLIVNEDEREQMAVLLLRAGELASMSAAHLTAQDYVGLAMSMLGRRHWRDQYQLSLRLYDSAAEIEYCIGNFDRVDQLTNEILENARSNKDKIRAQTNRMYSLGSRNQLQEAIDVGFFALKEYFGITFPSKPSLFAMIRELMKTKRILRGFPDDVILALPTMEDPMKLSAMRIMVLLFNYTLTGRPMFAPLMSMRLVQYSLLHGVSAMAGPAFSTLAMIMCLAFNDINSCIRYGRLGLHFLEAFDAREWLPRVYCAVFGFCFTFTEPLHEQIQPLLLSHRVGLGGGDIEFALLSAALYTSVSISSSARLSLLSSEVTTFLSLSDYYHQRNMAQFLRPNAQFIHCMRGACRNPSILDGEALDLDKATKEAVETKNITVITMLLLLRLLVASFFRQFDDVEKFGKELAKLRMDSFTCYCKATVWLHEGISLVELSHDQQRRRRLGIAKKHLKNLVKLSAFSRHNYGNKVSLLEAEISVAEGKFHQALLKYEDAISQAKESKQWSEVGLAAERVASALRRRNRMDEARTYLDHAASAYERWGATAKVLEIRSSVRPDGVVRPCYPEELVSMTQTNGGSQR